MVCVEQDPDLFKYERWPELFIVPFDFCQGRDDDVEVSGDIGNDDDEATDALYY